MKFNSIDKETTVKDTSPYGKESNLALLKWQDVDHQAFDRVGAQEGNRTPTPRGPRLLRPGCLPSSIT